jgi:hypothetical protein
MDREIAIRIAEMDGSPALGDRGIREMEILEDAASELRAL